MNRVGTPGSAGRLEEGGQLPVDPRPVDLVRQAHQLVAQVDDLVEPRAEQIGRAVRLRLLRPHRCPPRCGDKNHGSSADVNPPSRITESKSQDFGARPRRFLQNRLLQSDRNRFPINRLAVVHGRL
jgi:hypothetical protein